jgi:hypothetical protein
MTIPTLLLALSTQTASAANSVRQAGNFGLGLGGGNFVSGLSVKYFLADDMALEGTLGSWHFGGVGVSGALLWEMPNLAEEDDFDINWNIGPGAAFWTYSYNGPGNYGFNAFAITAVLGLEMDLNDVPLDLVIEWRPGVYVYSVTSGVYGYDGAQGYFGGFGGHIRYFF